ncbi:MAG: hypothetical protein N2651_06175 [Fimbriimonadales bacterium]|nr:hypothetical protein [Fimbriimonadales bacterium]
MKTEWQAQVEPTPLERRLRARLRHVSIGSCLSFEQLLTLARQGHHAPNYHTLMQHVITCRECRQMVLQARALVQAQRPSWARWLQRLALLRPLMWAPAAGVAALALAFFLWQGREANQRIAENPTGNAGEPSVSIAQHDTSPTSMGGTQSGTALPQLADSRLTQPEPERPPAPPSQRELQQAAQYPSFVGNAVKLLSQAAATLGNRSASNTVTPWLEFIQPDLQRNISILPQTRRFQWTPVAEASGYLFILRRTDGDTIAQATLAADKNEFTLDAPLPPAQYEVRIVAQLPDQARTLRREFYVLNPEQQQRYAWAQQYAEKSPLLSAAVFYQIDRFEDALRCVERAARKYPNDPQVDLWRRVVQLRINLRLGEYD